MFLKIYQFNIFFNMLKYIVKFINLCYYVYVIILSLQLKIANKWINLCSNFIMNMNYVYINVISYYKNQIN